MSRSYEKIVRTMAVPIDMTPDTREFEWVDVGPGRKLLVPKGGRSRLRKMDNKSFESTNLAPAKSQIGEWNKKFGGPGSGVRFYVNDKGVPVAKFRDRQAKLEHMDRRSGKTVRLVDFDEVRSR